MIISFEECSKCQAMCAVDELTECIHYETGECLGKLCDICVEDWLQHLDTLNNEDDA